MMIDTSPRFFCDAVTGDWLTDPWPRLPADWARDAVEALARERHRPGTMRVYVSVQSPLDVELVSREPSADASEFQRERLPVPRRRRLIGAPGTVALAIIVLALVLLAIYLFRAI